MKNRTTYIYLVYCNLTPSLVYGVFSSKKSALKYAYQLVRWREEKAKERGWEFGYYHQMTEDKRPETDFDKREKYIFSVSLRIKDGAPPDMSSEDATLIQVVRRPLLK